MMHYKTRKKYSAANRPSGDVERQWAHLQCIINNNDARQLNLNSVDGNDEYDDCVVKEQQRNNNKMRGEREKLTQTDNSIRKWFNCVLAATIYVIYVRHFFFVYKANVAVDSIHACWFENNNRCRFDLWSDLLIVSESLRLSYNRSFHSHIAFFLNSFAFSLEPSYDIANFMKQKKTDTQNTPSIIFSLRIIFCGHFCNAKWKKSFSFYFFFLFSFVKMLRILIVM